MDVNWIVNLLRPSWVAILLVRLVFTRAYLRDFDPAFGPIVPQAVVGDEHPRLSRVRGVRNGVIAFIRVLICWLQDTPSSLLPQLGSCIRPTNRGLN